MNLEHAAILELDKLKGVLRATILSDGTRRENTAEHSWHIAMALLALQPYMPEGVNVDHAIRMALSHDVCEIGAGDVPAYSSKRGQETADEERYIEYFKQSFGKFGSEVSALWHEYNEQKTAESQWVKLADRILPFMLNLATEGRIWKQRDICRSQVLNLNLPVKKACPAVYEWMEARVEEAVNSGWLRDA